MGRFIENVRRGLLKKRAKARFLYACLICFLHINGIIYIYCSSLYILVEIIGIKCYNIYQSYSASMIII